jgi:hypothetical protein
MANFLGCSFVPEDCQWLEDETFSFLQIIDEGHRPKSKDPMQKTKDPRLFSTLEVLATHQRILLTGAPLPVGFLMLVRY